MSNWYKQSKKESLKDQLIRLGSENLELQKHLKPVLDRITKTASGVSARDIMRKLKKEGLQVIDKTDEPFHEQILTKGGNPGALFYREKGDSVSHEVDERWHMKYFEPGTGKEIERPVENMRDVDQWIENVHVDEFGA